MIENNEIFSDDVFISIAISSLLNEICLKNNELNNKKINVLVISKASLLSLPNIYRNLSKRKRYAIISSQFIFTILNETSNQLKVDCFIDIDDTVENIKHQLLMYSKGISSNKLLTNTTEQRLLSYREMFVLRYISIGMTPSFIARLSGVSVKTISSQKRNIMKKLCVSNNQQLFIKSQLIKISKESPPSNSTLA